MKHEARLRWICAVVAAALVAAGPPAFTQTARPTPKVDPYSIMAPEPWLAPKHQSPRGIPDRPKAAKPRPVPSPTVGVAKPAPPIVLPNGQVVPNLPPVNQGMVPGGGRETFGDRALRCSHQSGLYGVPAGQQPTYMHSCTMQ